MSKKHMSGFVPVNYKIAGKVILLLSILIFIARIIEFITDTHYISNLINKKSTGEAGRSRLPLADVVSFS